VRVALVGTGVIALQNHIPGIRLHPSGEVVALCDPDPRALRAASSASGVERTYADYRAVVEARDIDAVVIATPNHVHAPIALAALESGKHVLCEKPLAMGPAQAEQMALSAARLGLVNMTAFTYRFVPAIRWMHRLLRDGTLGTLYHVRIRRLQDWGDAALGWRQQRALAASGELGDMLAHRIDYVHHLVGGFSRVVAGMKQLLPERRRPDGTMQGADVDDWVAVIAELAGGTTAVLESTKLAIGRGSGPTGEDHVEINGSGGTLIYQLARPHELLVSHPGRTPEARPVPLELLKVPGSPRDPHAGDPLQGFRHDQGFEFVQAIAQGRPASPDFVDGWRVQEVMDAIVSSSERRAWVDVVDVKLPA
jgi:predicted dehydrogenase